MEVFVIPVGPGRHELYYEHNLDDDEEDEDAEPSSRGLLARFQQKFAELLRTAEAARREREAESPAEAPQSWMARLRARMMSWVAERIAEQRLLWHLRKQERAVVVHPADEPFDDVLARMRRDLRRDYERHRFWLVVDTIGMVVSWPLTVIPGPNVLLFYFMFRAGGHWLSMRGAEQGRARVEWTGRPCEALTTLRAALAMDGRARQQAVEDVAAALHLRDLPTFFDRLTGGGRKGREGQEGREGREGQEGRAG